jgi:hypothetical protein
MFVRRINNKSGVISIQVIGKPNGKYKLLKTIGSSSNPEEIEHLYHLSLEWIDDERNKNQKELDFTNEEELLLSSLNQIDNITESGSDALLGKIFEILGIGKFQTRKWNEWLHQAALNLMVSSFILKEKLRNNEDLPLLIFFPYFLR